MKPNDSPLPRLRAIVACVLLGADVSCGDDDDSASTAAPTPATPFATAGPRHDVDDDTGRVLGDGELDCAVG